MDAAILRTLARIKRKDPGIYEEGKNIFGGMLSMYLFDYFAKLLCAEEQEKTTQSAKTALTRPAGPTKVPKDKVRFVSLRIYILGRSSRQ